MKRSSLRIRKAFAPKTRKKIIDHISLLGRILHLTSIPQSVRPNLPYHPSQKVDFGPPPPGYIPGAGRGVLNTHTFGGALDGGGRFKGKRIPGQPIESASSDAFLIDPVAEKDGERQWSLVDNFMVLPKKRKSKQLPIPSSSPYVTSIQDSKTILSKLRADEWLSIPDAGDPLSRELRNDGSTVREHWTPVPDSFVPTFSHSQLRSSILTARLEGVKQGERGEQRDYVDTNEYLKQLQHVEQLSGDVVDQSSLIGDPDKIVSMFNSQRRKGVPSLPLVLAAIKSFEIKNLTSKIKEICNEYVEKYHFSEELWLESIKYHGQKESILTLSRALRYLPNSENLWLKFVNLHVLHSDQVRLYHEALENIPNSKILYKSLIKLLPDNDEKLEVLSRVVRQFPDDYELLSEMIVFELKKSSNLIDEIKSRDFTTFGQKYDVIMSFSSHMTDLVGKFQNFVLLQNFPIKNLIDLIKTVSSLDLFYVFLILNSDVSLDNLTDDLSNMIDFPLKSINHVLNQSFVDVDWFSTITDVFDWLSSSSPINDVYLSLFLTVNHFHSTLDFNFSNFPLSFPVSCLLIQSNLIEKFQSNFHYKLMALKYLSLYLNFQELSVIGVSFLSNFDPNYWSIEVFSSFEFGNYCNFMAKILFRVEDKTVFENFSKYLVQIIEKSPSPELIVLESKIKIFNQNLVEARVLIEQFIPNFEKSEDLYYFKFYLITDLTEFFKNLSQILTKNLVFPSIIDLYCRRLLENQSNSSISMGKIRALIERSLKLTPDQSIKCRLWLILIDLESKIDTSTAISTISRALMTLQSDFRGPIYSKYLSICPPPLKKSITREAISLLPSCPFVLSSSALVLASQMVYNKAKKFLDLVVKNGCNNGDLLAIYVQFCKVQKLELDLSKILIKIRTSLIIEGSVFDQISRDATYFWTFDLDIVTMISSSVQIS
ncbi:hypothetical protein RCL1_007011 [Eukaryota sp. TZLM3-RCL]